MILLLHILSEQNYTWSNVLVVLHTNHALLGDTMIVRILTAFQTIFRVYALSNFVALGNSISH